MYFCPSATSEFFKIFFSSPVCDASSSRPSPSKPTPPPVRLPDDNGSPRTPLQLRRPFAGAGFSRAVTDLEDFGQFTACACMHVCLLLLHTSVLCCCCTCVLCCWCVCACCCMCVSCCVCVCAFACCCYLCDGHVHALRPAHNGAGTDAAWCYDQHDGDTHCQPTATTIAVDGCNPQ